MKKRLIGVIACAVIVIAAASNVMAYVGAVEPDAEPRSEYMEPDYNKPPKNIPITK